MKKLGVSILLGTSLFLVLTGCSEGDVVKEALEDAKESEVKDVKLGKKFKVVKKSIISDTQEAEITIDNYEIVQDVSTLEEANEKYDYVKFDVVFENVGKTESNGFIGNANFSFYDENGKEIEKGYVYNFSEPVFKEAKLRPGGKNEGKLLIAITKGVTPAEMVYEPSIGPYSNQYVFEMK